MNLRASRLLFSFFAATLSIFSITVASTRAQTQTISLDSPDQLKPVNVKIESVTFKGRKALRVSDAAPAGLGDEGRLVVLSKTDFQDGIIEIDLAGEPGPTPVKAHEDS